MLKNILFSCRIITLIFYTSFFFSAANASLSPPPFPPKLSLSDFNQIFISSKNKHLKKGTEFEIIKDGRAYKGRLTSDCFQPSQDEILESRSFLEETEHLSHVLFKTLTPEGYATYNVLKNPKPFYGPKLANPHNESFFLYNPGVKLPLSRLHPPYKRGHFIVKGLAPMYHDSELHKPDNVKQKKKSRVSIQNGQLITAEGKALHAKFIYPRFIWVIDKKGTMYVAPPTGEKTNQDRGNHHSFLNKTKDGFGKSIAAAGEIETTVDGKITYLNNYSGHYQPTKDQFFTAIKWLISKDKNIFDPNAILFEMTENRTYSLKEIEETDVEKIISKYPTKEESNFLTSGSESEPEEE